MAACLPSPTNTASPHTVPITEEFPLSATNPYGRSKLMIEQILSDLYMADPAWNIILLRYFNPVGAHDSGRIGEDPNGIPNNLLPYIAQVAVGRLNQLSIFGGDYPTHNGTGVRDYIHVVDLALGHLKALEKLDVSPGLVAYNLGTGQSYSVRDVIVAFERASGRTIPHTIVERRPGEGYALNSVRTLKCHDSTSIIRFDDNISECIIDLPMLADVSDFL